MSRVEHRFEDGRTIEGYDVIGDVHGHADMLVGLLNQIGYTERDDAWRHANRQAIFIGDLIDRGPAQRDTVDLARAMVDAGTARMVIGNHEFNAIAWTTPNPEVPGEFLRPHHAEKGAANRHQHGAFLDQVGESSALHREYLDWFRSLPLWLDLGGLRIVHACWNTAAMNTLRRFLSDDGSLTYSLIVEGSRKGSAEYDAIETVLKGPEIDLPEGFAYLDHGGIRRDRARTRWWDADARTLRDAAEIPWNAKACDGTIISALPDTPITDGRLTPYADDIPVIFGHYWRTADSPVCYPKSTCVDYSAGGGGPLVAYRWSGGDLEPGNLEFFPPDHRP